MRVMPSETPFAPMRLPKGLAVAIPGQRAGDRPPRVIGLIERRTEEHRDAVAHDAIDGAAVLERDSQHSVEISLQQRERRLGRKAFGRAS